MKTPGIKPILLLAPVALICAAVLSPPRAQFAQTQSDAVTVQVDRPGAAISPTLFGLFFEDINFGADGGLYPERVKNRSFEFPDPMMGWKRLARGEAKGTLQIYDGFDEAVGPTRITCESKPTPAAASASRTRAFAASASRRARNTSSRHGARMRATRQPRCASKWKTPTARSSAKRDFRL